MNQSIPIERLRGGKPILSPLGDGWESGVTFNTAALLLDPTPPNRPAIRALLGFDSSEPIVVLHYRARPKTDPGFRFTRSYVGVSIHRLDLTPIRRWESPVVEPGSGERCFDSLGVEDPRISWLDGAWWMVYCGVAPAGEKDWHGSVCLARSDDLVHWEKCGAAVGVGDGFASGSQPARYSNKDGVLFPERIDGKVYMLHRPMDARRAVRLARADSPIGPWEDLGPIHGANRPADARDAWVGAGSVPIALGGGRYVSIEHTGNALMGGGARYVLDAYLYDFSRLDPNRPESIVVSAIDEMMRPETDFEVNGPFPDSVANVVFTCGSYVQDGYLTIVYGGGDSYILAARLPFARLLDALESREKVRS